MNALGTVQVCDRVSVPNSGQRAWRVMVLLDTPAAIPGGDGHKVGEVAFYLPRPPDPSPTTWASPPLVYGDRIAVPLLHGGTVHVIRDSRLSTLTERMIGWAFDPDHEPGLG